MAVIRFTESDRLAGKTLEKGGYTVIMTKCDGPKASASGKSVSFFATFMVTKGKYVNKEIEVAFNSESRGDSILGSMQWLTSRSLLKVAAAITGQTIDDVPLDLDTDTLLNKPFDIVVSIETSDGNLVNAITAFVPEGKATVAPF